MATQSVGEPTSWRRASAFPRSVPFTWLLAFGPGLVVMLADTEAGSIITAAQSGARWGYRLLALQLVLIPVLFITQELTVRLGITTRQGHGELIRRHFGPAAAWLSVVTLAVACVGALITELGCLAAVGSLFAIPVPFTLFLVVSVLLIVVWTGSYRSVERVALAIGTFELAFLVVAWQAHPNIDALASAVASVPARDSGYLYLAAANIGAVIMPWMVFYQQSAIVDKGLGSADLNTSRLDTALGAVVTQLIMCAVLVASAATFARSDFARSFGTVGEISATMTSYIGPTAGRLLFAAGMAGAALVAAIVVSLTAAWGLGEVAGYRRSLENSPRQAPWFYGIYTFAVLASAGLILAGADVVRVSVSVEVMNALLLPVVLGFLFLLALKALPAGQRLSRPYAFTVGVVLAATSMFGVFAALSGIFPRL